MNIFAVFPLFLALFSVCYGEFSLIQEKVFYPLSTEPIDVVIPSIQKDKATLDLCIEGIKKNGKNIRRVIVVSAERMTDKAEWFDEKRYPFSKEDVAIAIFHDKEAARNYLRRKDQRIGWIYQQLLKFYAFKVIPDLSSNMLILDSDTVFLNPVDFFNNEGEGLFNMGESYYIPYFAHMERFIPGLKRVYPQYSGVSHHMLFQKPVLQDLFAMVESYHGMQLWEAFCRSIDLQALSGSSASEYEIYFNFVFTRSHQMKLRLLNWQESRYLDLLARYQRQGFHYVTFHSYALIKPGF